MQRTWHLIDRYVIIYNFMQFAVIQSYADSNSFVYISIYAQEIFQASNRYVAVIIIRLIRLIVIIIIT